MPWAIGATDGKESPSCGRRGAVGPSRRAWAGPPRTRGPPPGRRAAPRRPGGTTQRGDGARRCHRGGAEGIPPPASPSHARRPPPSRWPAAAASGLSLRNARGGRRAVPRLARSRRRARRRWGSRACARGPRGSRLGLPDGASPGVLPGAVSCWPHQRKPVWHARPFPSVGVVGLSGKRPN